MITTPHSLSPPLVSRVAESCLWMYRYLERAESITRLLGVNRSFVMSAAGLPPEARWRPMILASGEEEGFAARHGEDAWDDDERVQEDLTWNPDCPVSVFSSIRWARENARTCRETISLELWVTLNGLWLWLNAPEARALYDAHRHQFYARILERCQQLLGVCTATLLRDQAYDFMQVGMLLERVGQTARLLDVRYHLLDEGAGRAEDNLFWITVLRSCCAYEMFLKRSRGVVRGDAIFRFLLLEPTFPRAVHFGLEQAEVALRYLRPHRSPVGADSADRLAALRVWLVEDAPRTPGPGVHDALEHLIDAVDGVFEAIQRDYFFFTPPEPTDPAP